MLNSKINSMDRRIETMHIIANRISAQRIKMGLSKKELATILGISPSSVSSYEQETNIPSITVLTKMCALFNVSADYLLGIEKAPNSSSAFSLDGLTQSQIEAVESMIKAFRETN